MSAPPLHGIDHVHVFVRDRAAATSWYRDVMGFGVAPEFAGWAGGGGPLTLRDAGDHVHLALFERPGQPNRATIALRVDAAGLATWHGHLSLWLGQPPVVEDHELSVSLYFSDPDGNPFEITTYEHAAARALVPR
jgi:catechol 2,3-dioxygenase-like lactoylglutathione lyase family enzyme